VHFVKFTVSDKAPNEKANQAIEYNSEYQLPMALVFFIILHNIRQMDANGHYSAICSQVNMCVSCGCRGSEKNQFVEMGHKAESLEAINKEAMDLVSMT